MKTPDNKWQDGATTARSVLECGSPLPLSERRVPSKGASGLAQSKTWRAFARASALVILFAATSLRAQNFSIDWFTIDGGGGTSTGGVYALSGTIGQPDANAQPLTGGNFSLAGGFWSLLAVQTPDAPLLTIQLTTTNTALVSWSSPSPGFTLQQNSALNTTNWIPALHSVFDDGTNRFIVISPLVGHRFYRLFKP